MSERILSVADVLHRMEKVFKKMDGDDLADLHNKFVDGTEVTYDGDGIFIEEVKK